MWFNGKYPLVNFHRKLWKDPPLFSGKTHYVYGHVEWLCSKLPESGFMKCLFLGRPLCVKRCAGLVSFTLSKTKLRFKLEFRFLCGRNISMIQGLVDIYVYIYIYWPWKSVLDGSMNSNEWRYHSPKSGWDLIWSIYILWYGSKAPIRMKISSYLYTICGLVMWKKL